MARKMVQETERDKEVGGLAEMEKNPPAAINSTDPESFSSLVFLVGLDLQTPARLLGF